MPNEPQRMGLGPIVEWLKLSCGHVVDLTETEQLAIKRFPTLVCPKCNARETTIVKRAPTQEEVES